MGVQVHFNTKPNNGGRNLTAIPHANVTAVVLVPKAQSATFAQSVMFKGKPLGQGSKPLSDFVTLIDEQGNVIDALAADEGGPPVCYWVGDELICW